MRLPVLQGSRVTVARVPDDTVVIAAPEALDPIADVAAAVSDAVRYPLAGGRLDKLVPRGGRVTILVEPPFLPVPGARLDPRQDAIAGVIDELVRIGVPTRNHTLLVAAGLERRPRRRDLERLLRPGRARDFSGTVVVHDVEGDDLLPLDATGATPARASRHLLEADAAVVVTAAETVAHGGPSTLARACDAQTARRLAGGASLLEAHGSEAWDAALSVENGIERHVPLVGVSLVLDHPRPSGRLRGWPAQPAADRLAASRLRAAHGVLPRALRIAALQHLDRELHAVSALAGTPSVAHAEAILRGTAMRGTPVPRPLRALIVPVPWKSLHQPREALNPITAAAATAQALRLWRGRPALVPGGTVIVPHPFGGTIGRGPEAPFLRLYHAVRGGATGRKLAAVERLARTDARALERYRAGAAPHPLLPFADWTGICAALEHVGRVIVAGCRDASAARALGFVPTHNLAAALGMAAGVTESDAPTGVILAPPYPPLLVG